MLNNKDLKRKLNEAKFSNWLDLPNRGRRYWYEVKGKYGFKAKYVKEVDFNEETVKFYQEIYDENNNLIEIHEKFPVNRGHKRLL